jgi:large subunit ribosomal protein L1
MLAVNAAEVIQTLTKLKPSSAKGTYIRSVTLSSTMSPAVTIDKNSI